MTQAKSVSSPCLRADSFISAEQKWCSTRILHHRRAAALLLKNAYIHDSDVTMIGIWLLRVKAKRR
jgi:hypothetical protein